MLDFFANMSTYDIIIQAIGFVAMVFFVISFQAKKRSTLLILQTTSILIFGIQFFLMESWTAVILEGVCLLRNSVYFFKGKCKAIDSIFVPIFFIIVAIVVGIFTYEAWYSVLIVVANILQTIALTFKNEKMNRCFYLCASPMWMVYNFCVSSIFGVLTECFNIISIIISIVRIVHEEHKMMNCHKTS